MKKKRIMGVVCTFLSACTLLGTLNVPVFAKTPSTVKGTVSDDEVNEQNDVIINMNQTEGEEISEFGERSSYYGFKSNLGHR